MADIGREVIEIVEIDLDYCSLTYGVGPCTAALGVTGEHKCFNGYATCQAKAAFDKITKTLRYGTNVSGLPVVKRISSRRCGLSRRERRKSTCPGLTRSPLHLASVPA